VLESFGYDESTLTALSAAHAGGAVFGASEEFKPAGCRECEVEAPAMPGDAWVVAGLRMSGACSYNPSDLERSACTRSASPSDQTIEPSGTIIAGISRARNRAAAGCSG
jgi:hypothetical protein